MNIDIKIINRLFELIDECKINEEFPVAAIIFKDNKIISEGFNKRNTSKITTDHAEIIAIQAANKILNEWRLDNLSMIVTLEPCDMCKSVIKEARLKNIFYIIPRYYFKRQYKNSEFIELKIDSEKVSSYKQNIKHFFDNKR